MKKLLSVFLTLAMLCGVFSAFSITSSAAESAVYIGNVELRSNYLLLTGETELKQLPDVLEEYTVEELLNKGFAALSGDHMLMHNFEYNGPGYGEARKRKAAIRGKNISVQISGENKIVCTSENGVGIYVEGDLSLNNGASNAWEERTAKLDIDAPFGIMVMDDADSNYNPRFALSAVDVIVNTDGGIGLAVGSELRSAYVSLYSGSLTIKGDGSSYGIALVAPDGNSRQFACYVADLVIDNCDVGVYSKDILFYGGSYICYATNCGLYGEGGNVDLSKTYIDIIVTATAGNSIKASMTTIDTKTMYVDFGTVVDNTFVAYLRTYVIVGGVYLYDGDYLATGGYKSTTDKPSTGGYAYYTVNDRGVGVLELFDFEVSESSSFTWGRSGAFEGEQASVSSPYDLKLVLKGENAITPEKYDYGIAIYGSLSVEGDGSLDIGDDEHSDGILILGDYATDDIAFAMESGSLNVYSKNSILLYCFDYDKDATITINGGSLFMRSIDAVAADNAEGIIEINGGKLEISGTGIFLSGVGKTGYYQNGGIVEIEATTAESSIVGIYNRDNEFGGYFEIYGGEFSVREKNGEDVITTTCDSPVLGQGMAVVEGDWDTAYIKIAKKSGSTDHDYILGDVNNDEKINQYDYILVKRHYFGTRYLTDDEMTRADVNGDGNVNQYDYILIKRHYFGTYVIGG